MNVPNNACGAPASLSIRSALRGHSVLLTGSTGYVGSLVLEQLLRCVPGVDTVYVLIRDRKNDPAATRLRKLLHSGLFHMVRDKPELLAKVCLVRGCLADLQQHASSHEHISIDGCSTRPSTETSSGPGSPHTVELAHADTLVKAADPATAVPKVFWDAEGQLERSLCVADLVEAQTRTQRPLVVIHCAARIALEDPIKRTLSDNYLGTRALLSFARELPGIAGFVHVSSAFVNCNKLFLPEGTVHEEIYPLKFGEAEADHVDVVSRLMALEGKMANARCAYLCDLWGIPNSYVLGKYLTEKLVNSVQDAHMPVAIVRPALVGAVAGAPYPGYVGNLAGPSGMAVAWFLGFVDKHGTALQPNNHLDCVPGEVASSVIVAAAAALVSQPRAASAQTTQVYHATTSCVQPISHREAVEIAEAFSSWHPTVLIKLGRNMAAGTEHPGHCKWKAKLARKWLAAKVGLVAACLACWGRDAAARHLRSGHLNFQLQVQSDKNNHRLFFDVSRTLSLERALCVEERGDFPLVWRGDWVRYGYTYMAAVVKLFLGRPVPPSTSHDFKYIPSRRLPAAAGRNKGRQ